MAIGDVSVAGEPARGGEGVPRRALPPLAVCLGAAIVAGVALATAARVGGAAEVLLLGLGWLAVGVAVAAALVFAARSGRLDERPALERPAPPARVAGRKR